MARGLISKEGFSDGLDQPCAVTTCAIALPRLCDVGSHIGNAGGFGHPKGCRGKDAKLHDASRDESPFRGLGIWARPKIPFFILNHVGTMLLPEPAVIRTHEDIGL